MSKIPVGRAGSGYVKLRICTKTFRPPNRVLLLNVFLIILDGMCAKWGPPYRTLIDLNK
jgi:hypothetical protein